MEARLAQQLATGAHLYGRILCNYDYWRGRHRNRVRLARHRALSVRIHFEPRLPCDAGRSAHHDVAVYVGEPKRGHCLCSLGSEDSPLNALLRQPVFAIAVALSSALVILAIFAPWLAPHNPMEGNLMERLLPPAWQEDGTWRHLLGTDVLGRDILSRLIYGARVSLGVCALAILL